LKKEAFKVANDMSVVIKMFAEEALSKEGGVEMLACILEFLLDLCEEEELGTVAFFWPQLRHVHLRMLPPRDANALVRVELVEDFLLTVSCRHSVQLALELLWGLAADMEEGFEEASSNACRSRRYAVMNFTCELEGLLFGLEGGQTAGCLVGALAFKPSVHQSILIREQIGVLQLHRKFSGHHLTRSARMDDLARGERDETNSRYFRSQVSFVRELGEIAETLRFTENSERDAVLEKELERLNATLGGDPLSRAGEGLSKVVHIPQKEGHVFRSKERTPILLLMEVLRPPQEADVNEGNTARQEDEGAADDAVDAASPVVDSNTLDSAALKAPDSNPLHDSAALKSLDSNPLNDCAALKSLDSNPLNDSAALKSLDSNPLNDSASPKTLDSNPLNDSAALMTLDSNPLHASAALRLVSKAFGPKPTKKISRKSSSLSASSVLFANTKPISPHNDVCTLINSTIKKKLTLEELSINYHNPPPIVKPPPARPPTALKPHPPKRNQRRVSKIRPSMARRFSPLQTSQAQNPTFDEFGEGRRQVLTTILAMRGNAIAKRASYAAKRAVQAMDRHRAVELIQETVPAQSPRFLGQLQEEFARDETEEAKTIATVPSQSDEEHEIFEALRLLLLQNRPISRNNSENALDDIDAAFSVSLDDEDLSRDAGQIDPRLAGCGVLNGGVLNALKLWKGGTISDGELLELVHKDLRFASQNEEESHEKILNNQFWVRFAFGERWAEKKARIAATSPHGAADNWDLVGLIVKSNDDLRQEAFVMQLIELSQLAFEAAGVKLWLQPYQILATGRSTGIIEMCRNALSLDSLKKRSGYSKGGGLRGHFERMVEFDTDPGQAFRQCQHNFVTSLAAYSLLSYFFMFKDRHNGNLLLDTQGHVIHIDFGFVFGIAPGGSFSLEMSTPFKLTEEMLAVMGGISSPLFSEFVTLFCCGFLALQAHAGTICTLVEVTARGSTFPCFHNKNAGDVVAKLHQRFRTDLDKQGSIVFALDLIKQASASYGTKHYDFFQYLSQGIAA